MKPYGSHSHLFGALLFLLILQFDGIEGRRKKSCKYSRSIGPCDPATKTQLVNFTLADNGDQRCRPTRVKSRSCDPRFPSKDSECRYYRKGEKGLCDYETKSRSVTVSLKSGQSSCAPTKTLIKPCEPRTVNPNKKIRKEACKYFRKGDKGLCDRSKGTQNVVIKLKKGGPSCAPTVTISKPCMQRKRGKEKKKKKKKKNRKNRLPKCRYNRRDAVWSECDSQTNKKTKVMQLVSPNPLCASTQTKTRNCRRKKKKRVNDCLYVRQAWSACDERTNTRQREKVLTSGDPTVCLPKKVVTKKCRKECRYTKGNWTECDPETNLKDQSLTPVPGSPPQCQPTVHTKPCSPQAELTAAKPHKCKYVYNQWSSCDPRSNTMTQIMALKNGDPNVCKRSVKLTKKCRLACKFRRGEWSECDEQTGLTMRVDTLLKGRPEQCDATRQITKKCRKKACKYSLSDWSECDPVTNDRSRIKKLLKGDVKECQGESIVSKSCLKRDGEARCFFGSYGEFGPCTNGVMTRHRPVLQGDVVECQRKAVITKACG